MREPKFRAWDKITKHYYAVSGLEYDDNGELCEIYIAGIQIDESDPCANVREPSDVVLEQDTGLKDRNGKEIYEGDIVQCYDRRFKSIDKRLSGPSVVDRFFGDTLDYEVLGNIHENSELCGKKKAEEAIKFIAKLNRAELKKKEQ